MGFTLCGDLRLNIANSQTADVLEKSGFDSLILSPELTLPRIRDILSAHPSARAIIYGRAPLMVTEKCVGRELGDCRDCENGNLALTDRKGIRFPVLKEFGHRSVIVNSVPIYMADRKDELLCAGISSGHFIFTVESTEEISRVIHAYRKGLSPTFDVRRIK